MTFAELRVDVVILAAAVSAGIHGALGPGHFEEGAGAGLGFAAAAAALAACVVWLTVSPGSRRGLRAVAAVLLGLLGSYALAITTGVPLLHPDPEPVDGLALATKAIEAVGLLAATGLPRRGGPARSGRPIPVALTLLVAVFGGLATLAVTGDHHSHDDGRPDVVAAR